MDNCKVERHNVHILHLCPCQCAGTWFPALIRDCLLHTFWSTALEYLKLGRMFHNAKCKSYINATHNVLSAFCRVASEVGDDGQNASRRIDEEELVNVVRHWIRCAQRILHLTALTLQIQAKDAMDAIKDLCCWTVVDMAPTVCHWLWSDSVFSVLRKVGQTRIVQWYNPRSRANRTGHWLSLT